MNSLNWIKAFLFLFLSGISLTACSSGPSDEESIAVMVALTQTSAAGATEAAGIPTPEETEVPEDTFPGDLQPLSPDECEQLAAFMVNRLPVPPAEQREVAVEHEGEAGSGCQAIAVGTGDVPVGHGQLAVGRPETPRYRYLPFPTPSIPRYGNFPGPAAQAQEKHGRAGAEAGRGRSS